MQKERFAALGRAGVMVNGDMGSPLASLSEVQKYCNLDDAGKNCMRAAVRQMDLSARAYHPVPGRGTSAQAAEHNMDTPLQNLWNRSGVKNRGSFPAMPPWRRIQVKGKYLGQDSLRQ